MTQEIDHLSSPQPPSADNTSIPDGDQTHELSIDAAFSIAIGHFDADRLDKAETICRKILEAIPNHARAMHLLGLVIYKRGGNEQAADLITRAMELRPDLPEIHNSLGMVMMVLGRYKEGLDAYHQTLRLLPKNQAHDLPKLYSNIGNACQLLGRFDDALKYHERSLALKPDDPVAAWNRAHILLLHGEFLKGWPGNELRFELPKALKKFYPHRFGVPKWDGKPFPGKRLFIHDEQGLGDVIQFARYLPLVKPLGGTVIFEVRSALRGLFSDLPGVDELVERIPDTKPTLEFDLSIPLLSLPAVFGTTLDTVPADIPYVHADPGRTAQWHERFRQDGIRDDLLKVGVVWAGNQDNIQLRHRSFELRQLAPYLKLNGVQLIGLQKGAETAAQVERLPEDLAFPNYGEEFKDFVDTTAAVENLDLVVTIDTAVAHLAGAMGKPVWTLISYPPDWRWLLRREDNPWYPTMRLFRQQKMGEWWPLFEKVADALRARVNERNIPAKDSEATRISANEG
jgi:Flp pilus assembly protein TadD